MESQLSILHISPVVMILTCVLEALERYEFLVLIDCFLAIVSLTLAMGHN